MTASVNANGKRKRGRVPSPIQPRRPRHIAFGWYGGKYSHLDWLMPLLPEDAIHYCEPFGGSAAILINRPPAPVETYNDLDGEVVNFFKALREYKDRVVEAIGLTPFSREEFAIACQVDPTLDSVERARRFYIRARQVRIGLAQTASLGRWANCVYTSRAGMAGAISRWLGAVEDLPEIAMRLQRVQVENRPAIDVIRQYDGPDTLFYCDPPYVHGTRGDDAAYGYEMTNDDHRALAAVLNQVRGRVAVSGYDDDLMDELFPTPIWHKVYAEERPTHTTKGMRQEVLWCNYKPARLQQTLAAVGALVLVEEDGAVPHLPAEIDFIFGAACARVEAAPDTPFLDERLAEQVRLICRSHTRSLARLILACTLAVQHNPELDPRQPYSELATPGCFAGRLYDEQYVGVLCRRLHLPVQGTTAFLTPALRHSTVLVPGTLLVGRPREAFAAALDLLDAVATGRAASTDVFAEFLRALLLVREEAAVIARAAQHP